jgi:hypothetical protein
LLENVYCAPWDNAVKGMTIGIFGLIGFLIVVFLFVLNDSVLSVSLIIMLTLILASPFLWAPRGYVLHGNLVVVRRPIGEAEIALAQPASRWKWTWWGLRLFGSGGMYGYFGLFTFRGLGTVRMYATHRHKLVLVTDVNGKKNLLSPDDPEEFVRNTQELFLNKDETAK